MLTIKQIQQAEANFKEAIGRLAFDERDEYPDFQKETEKVIGRTITEEDWNDEEYDYARKIAGEIVEAAEQVAYQQRVGNKVAIAKAQTKFETALSYL